MTTSGASSRDGRNRSRVDGRLQPTQHQILRKPADRCQCLVDASSESWVGRPSTACRCSASPRLSALKISRRQPNTVSARRGEMNSSPRRRGLGAHGRCRRPHRRPLRDGRHSAHPEMVELMWVSGLPTPEWSPLTVLDGDDESRAAQGGQHLLTVCRAAGLDGKHYLDFV